MTGVTGELYTGLLEFEDSLFTLHLLRPGELFADVGANAGTYSLLASKIAHCHVIAFEPAASAAEMLRTNLALNGVTDQVEVVEKGVSDKASVLRFTTNKDALNQVTISEGPGTTAIQVDTLDALLGDREPSFIKIDVEGHEKQVIDGAQRVFASPKLLAIQIETGEKAIENEVLGLMTAQGYQPCVYEPLSRQLTVTKALSPHNTLFVRNLAEVQGASRLLRPSTFTDVLTRANFAKADCGRPQCLSREPRDDLAGASFERAPPMKILAAVVTYNRRELVGRCIDALQRQTRAPDLILVINNSSTDDTEEMLRAREIFHITQENSGSAGGWRRALDYAMQEGYDAAWLMDDDGFPGEAALATLEAAMNSDVACASSVVLQEDRPTHLVFPVPILDRNGLPVIFGLPRKVPTLAELRKIAREGVYPFAHLFNGALISVAAARRIGNVDQDFFMFGDEVDYLFRLRGAGRVISVLDAPHFHPDVSQRPYTAAKVYYYIKNTLILNGRYFNMVPLRDALTIVAALGRTAKRNGLREALSFACGSNAPNFYRAIFRGLRGEIGKDFLG